MATEWQEVPAETTLHTGDVIRVYAALVGSYGAIEAWQMETIATEIERTDNRFRVESWSYPDAEGTFFVKVRIVDPRPPEKQLAGGFMSGITCALVGAVSILVFERILGGLVSGGKYTKRTITETVTDTVESAGLELAKWAAMAVVGYIAVKSVARG